ncbi:MAG: hypothetical protein ACI9P7_002275, partial [Candidatus Azotimanducaceae bacterium]
TGFSTVRDGLRVVVTSQPSGNIVIVLVIIGSGVR